MNEIQVQDNPSEARFEVNLGSQLAVLTYRQPDGQLILVHTDVPPELEGRGIGSALGRAALETAKQRGLRVFPQCDFARAYIMRHPEYQDVPGFYEIVAAYDEPVQYLLVRARSFIYQVYPAAVEVPWPVQRTLGYGVGPKKNSEHFAWLQPQRTYLNLGFNYGTELPDPEGLLEGTGKLLRHVKIRRPEDLKNPALRDLLEAAVKDRLGGK